VEFESGQVKPGGRSMCYCVRYNGSTQSENSDFNPHRMNIVNTYDTRNMASVKSDVFACVSVMLLGPWLIEQGLTSHQTHYRSYRGRFLQVT